MPKNKSSSPPVFVSIRRSFGQTLTTLGARCPNLFVVDADLKSSLYLGKFASLFPGRFIECGVAENNAAAVAAGLAASGKTVFLTSFACFNPGINWATIKQSICANHADVKIIGSHAGLMSFQAGASHQMLEDIALMRSLPNMQVFAPLDAAETASLVKTVAGSHLPSYIRLVRPETNRFFSRPPKFIIGKSALLRHGRQATVIGYGPLLLQALSCSQWQLDIINCSSIKPLDTDTILKSVAVTGRCLCLEDHQRNGGLGEALASLFLSHRLHPRFLHLAVDNRFGQSAQSYQELYDHYGLSQKHLHLALTSLFSNY